MYRVNAGDIVVIRKKNGNTKPSSNSGQSFLSSHQTNVLEKRTNDTKTLEKHVHLIFQTVYFFRVQSNFIPNFICICYGQYYYRDRNEV